MHLCNPLLKGATFVLSCLILCRLLLQGNQPLLHFSSRITKLLFDSWKHLNALDSYLFCAPLCAACFSVWEEKCNLYFVCTYAILSPCSQKWFPSLFFSVVLISIHLYNFLTELRKFISHLFFSSTALMSRGLIEKLKMYPCARKLC